MNDITLNQEEYAVYKRMKETGDYILNISGRLWWANNNTKGALVEAASVDEYDRVLKLKEKGIIKHEHRNVNFGLLTDTGWYEVID